MALVSLSAMCHTVTSAFSCVGGGVVTQKAAMGFTKTRPLLRPGRRLCVVVTQTRAASAGTDTDNRKARKAGKQSANALAVHKRLKADDSYFWKLKGESFSRERMDRKTATELFGEDKSGPGSEFPSSSFEIESDTPVTRSGEVGKDVRAIDEFGEDFRNVVPEWTFDNLTKKDRMRYRKPSPIQRHCVPLALAGHDVLASAQTGSGKTVAFLLPLIASIVRQGGDARNTFGAISDSSRDPARPKALVLAPTRELALQIENEIEKLTFGVPVAENSVNNRWSAAVYGGSSARPQLQALAAGVEIIVATPGRLVDFLTRSPPMLSLSSCQFLVLDEADRMLDMGFEPSLRKIVEGSDLPRREKRQTLLFSATFPQELQNVARKSYLKPKFVSVAVGKVGKSNSAVEQRVVRVVGTGTKQDKFTTLVEIMEPSKTNVDEKTIIFVNKKRNAAWLAKMLQSSFDIKCAQVHGDRSQPQRELALAQFRSNETKILVATDAVARGIDVSDVTHVIQFDLPISPKEFESYTHRIGRTGRAGKSGLATAIYVPGFEKGIGNEDVAHLLVNSLTENGAATPDWLPAPKATGRRGGNAGQNNERTRNSSFDQRMEERAIRAGEGGQFDENFSRQRRPSEAPRAGSRGGGVYRGEFDDEFSRGARGAGRGGGRGGPIRGGYISTGARGSGRGGCGGARDDEEDVRGPGRGGYGGARGRGGGRGSRDAGRGSGVNRGRGGY